MTGIIELADRMVADIQERGLTPGDAYLSAAQAAKVLRTSTTRANRALQLLEHRRVLIRRQRTGAVIAEPSAETKKSAIRRVNFVVARNYLTTEGLGADGIVAGLQKALPTADFQFRFIPEYEEVSSVDSLLGEALRSESPEGFVLVRASLAIQKSVLSTGVPSVIYGTPYPMNRQANSIDRDHRHMGWILTDYLLSQGARSILVILRPTSLHGDNLLLDGVQGRLLEIASSCKLIVRSLPADEGVLQQSLVELTKSHQTPIGVICRSEPLALACKVAAGQMEKNLRKKNPAVAGICLVDLYHGNQHSREFPHIRLTTTTEQIGEQIGRMLQRQADGVANTPEHFLIETELGLPES